MRGVAPLAPGTEPGSLLDQVLAADNLAAAWRSLRKSGTTHETDCLASDESDEQILAETVALARDVRAGRYAPAPSVEIELLPRARIGSEDLTIAASRDRVMQYALALIVGPILDRAENAKAPQSCRSESEAIARVSEGREMGLGLVVEADLGARFDAIPRQALLDRLAAALPDASLQPLFSLWLTASPEDEHGTRLARGAPILPLFAELLLAHFDTLIRKEGRQLVRFGERFIILCEDIDTAEQALEDADRLLRDEGLELDFSTTRISSFANGFEFLGTRFDGKSQWSVNPHVEPVLRAEQEEIDEQDAPAFPPLLRTLHITEHGAYLHRRGGRIVVSRDDAELFEIPLEKLDQVCVAHEGKISFGALRHFLSHKIGFVVTSRAGEPVGWLDNLSGGNAMLHGEQFRRANDNDFCLQAARAIVGGKIANSRLIVRRYGRNRSGGNGDADADLAHLERRLAKAENLDVVRGLEGAAARRYFEVLGCFLGPDWNFRERNRRPPRDPVNVLLSYGYAILFQNVLTLLMRRGLHPYVGALHALADRHPGLASDLMEEFRPLVVDAVVLKLLLSGRIKPTHFDDGGEDSPCRLLPVGRRIFVESIEKKLDTQIKHPQSGVSIDLRRAIAGQASLWSEHVCRRSESYRPFVLH